MYSFLFLMCASSNHQTTALMVCMRGSLDPRTNLARKGLAGRPWFLNPTNFLFQILNVIGQVLLQPYICFLSLVELKRWLAKVMSFPHQHRQKHSSAQDTSRQGFPQTLLVGWVWGPDYMGGHWRRKCLSPQAQQVLALSPHLCSVYVRAGVVT